MTLIEHCRVLPPPNTVPENTMPLTFFDLLWLNFRPVSRIFFYDFPHSTSHFTQTIVPNFKTSLSLVLKHYFPFAGNLITPTNHNTKPTIRYLNGDSVSLTFSESTSVNFIHLTGNQIQDVDELSPFAPQLPPVKTENTPEGGCVVVSPVLAVQVTVFPNHGVAVGFTNTHAVADGSTMFNFIQTLASISKKLFHAGSNIDDSGMFQLPICDRSLIKDTKGLDTIYMSQMKEMHPYQNPSTLAPAKNVRATFVMSQTTIQGLKNLVATKRPSLAHVSSYTVVCAFVWTCLAQTNTIIDGDDENEVEHFLVTANCRARLDPPLPATYFGNCIMMSAITVNTTLLGDGEGSFLKAAELIGETVHKTVQSKEEGGILRGAELWFGQFQEAITKWKRKRITGIAGSLNFQVYYTDFGWGKPRKFEFVSERLSIARCKGSGGDLEFGLCLPENEMEVFSTIFAKALNNLVM